MTLLGRLFGLAMASFGADGGAVFARLKAGQGTGEALAIPVEIVELVYARAFDWCSLGRTDRAEPLFRALCLIDEEVADFWVGLGVCLRGNGRPDAAKAAFQSAAGLRPEWAIPRYHLLELAIRERDWDLADASLRAFEANAGNDCPPGVVDEVKRLRIALERGRANRGAHPLPPDIEEQP